MAWRTEEKQKAENPNKKYILLYTNARILCLTDLSTTNERNIKCFTHIDGSYLISILFAIWVGTQSKLRIIVDTSLGFLK